MSKEYISTKEIIERGNALNDLYSAYMNASGKDKSQKRHIFYDALNKYREDVHTYIGANPVDISEAL